MKFSAILFSSFLFATYILAAPSGRLQRRSPRSGQSHPLIPTGATKTTNGPEGNISNVQYSSNWAGAVLTAPPAGQTFDAVCGTFTIPKPSPPPGTSGSGTWAASAWVGIDGDTYGNAILQTGCDFQVTRSSSGSLSYAYACWYEWYPNPAYNFGSFPVTSGNVIKACVKSSSSSAGVATLENVSTGKTVSESLTAPSSSSHLGGQNAEWIVEDYEENGSLVPFADFGTVTFTSCSASTNSETLTTSGSTIIEIENSNGQVITDVTVPSSSEVQVVYE